MLIKQLKQELKDYYHMVTRMILERKGVENKWQE